MELKRKLAKKFFVFNSVIAASLFSSAANSANFVGNYYGGLPEKIVGDTLLKQLTNTSIFSKIPGNSETLGTDVAVSLSGTKFTQKFQLLVNLGADRSANFYIRPSSLTSSAPKSIGTNRDKSWYAFSGITARVDPSSHSVKVNLYGTAPYKNWTTYQSKSSALLFPYYIDGANSVSSNGLASDSSGSGILFRWSSSANYSLDANATAAVVTVYVAPSLSDSSGYISVNINQATYDSNTGEIVIGKQLTDSLQSFYVDGYSLSQWMNLPIIASSSSAAFNDDYLSVVGNIPAGSNPTDKYFADNAAAVYLGHTVTKASARQPRGISDDFYYCLSTFGLWCVERLFGAPSIDGADDHRIDPVIVSQPQPPSNIDSLQAYDVAEIGPPRRNPNLDDVDLAMNMLACGQEDPDDATSPLACTVDDSTAIAAFTALSLDDARTMRRALHDYADALESGAASPPTINTNNSAVNSWAIQNPELAETLLDGVISVMNSSSAVDQPSTKGAVRNRGKKMIRASCVKSSSVQEASDEGWICIKKAKVKTSDAGNRTGVPPNVQPGGQYYLQSDGTQTANFNTLIREIVNSSQIPPGFSSSNFGASVRAIARDGAPSGYNRGIVYLMNANFQGQASNTGRRFGFGLQHILSPGPSQQQRDRGITQDASIGHREDWAALGVGNDTAGQNQLTRIIMSAVTSTTAISSQAQRNSMVAGFSYARDYSSIVVANGSTYDTYTNIRIVIGGDGNIITAYPLKGAKHTQTKSDLK
ncbi:hypothetical protein [Burkholderia mayonis]|uniref:hypothetical protein n=1 Tax=Burkholderia mayonis TaxID=1385591 RepID=UPI000AFA7C8E|nr:hypothetical protein [Burkholderia mayonis]